MIIFMMHVSELVIGSARLYPRLAPLGRFWPRVSMLSRWANGGNETLL